MDLGHFHDHLFTCEGAWYEDDFPLKEPDSFTVDSDFLYRQGKLLFQLYFHFITVMLFAYCFFIDSRPFYLFNTSISTRMHSLSKDASPR